MQVPLRVCLVHKLYLDLHRMVKKLTRLIPSLSLVLFGLVSLFLFTLIQLVTYQANDFVYYPTLPEPNELVIRNMNSTNFNNSNLTIFNKNNHQINQTVSSSLTSNKTTSSNFSTNSLSSNLSQMSKSNFLIPITKFQASTISKSANITNLINITNHDYFDHPGFSHMIISSNKSSLIKAKKTDPFKIEALLTKSPSAFQANSREMNSLTNKGRIRQIIINFLSEHQNSEKEKQEKNSTLSNNVLSNQTFEDCPLLLPKLGKNIIGDSSLFFCLF